MLRRHDFEAFPAILTSTARTSLGQSYCGVWYPLGLPFTCHSAQQKRSGRIAHETLHEHATVVTLLPLPSRPLPRECPSRSWMAARCCCDRRFVRQQRAQHRTGPPHRAGAKDNREREEERKRTGQHTACRHTATQDEHRSGNSHLSTNCSRALSALLCLCCACASRSLGLPRVLPRRALLLFTDAHSDAPCRCHVDHRAARRCDSERKRCCISSRARLRSQAHRIALRNRILRSFSWGGECGWNVERGGGGVEQYHHDQSRRIHPMLECSND